MRSQAVKILKVEKETSDSPYWSSDRISHTVYFEDWKYTQKVMLSTCELEVVLLEDKMLRKGIDKQIIEEHRKLVEEMVTDEREYNCY